MCSVRCLSTNRSFYFMVKIYKKHCDYCGKYYEGRGRFYCSYSCSAKSDTHHHFQKGHNFGFQKGVHPPTEFKKGLIPWNKGKKLPHLSGKKSPHWKDGLKKSNNRYFSFQPNHPFAWGYGKNYVLHSRLVAEKCLGRYLSREEVVHHFGAKDDDRPEMLYVFPSQSAHWRFHKLKNKPALKSNLI